MPERPGRHPFPHFATRLIHACGPSFIAKEFLPFEVSPEKVISSRGTLYFEAEWDAHDVGLFVYLGRRRKLKDVVPRYGIDGRYNDYLTAAGFSERLPDHVPQETLHDTLERAFSLIKDTLPILVDRFHELRPVVMTMRAPRARRRKD